MKPITRVNKMLKAAGRDERLVRDSTGYYYVGGVAVSSMLTVHVLDDNANDHQLAIDHVNEVMTRELGKTFNLYIASERAKANKRNPCYDIRIDGLQRKLLENAVYMMLEQGEYMHCTHTRKQIKEAQMLLALLSDPGLITDGLNSFVL